MGGHRLTLLVPALGAIDDAHHQQHHGDLDQHADDGRQGRARLKAEQRNGRSHRQLEEVRGPDQRRRTGDLVLLADNAVEPVGQGGVEEDLDQDGNGQDQDDQRLLEDGLALKGEQQYQGRKQGQDGGMPEPVQGDVEAFLILFEQMASPRLG